MKNHEIIVHVHIVYDILAKEHIACEDIKLFKKYKNIQIF